MLQELVDYANSLRPNLPNDRCELWLKTGHYKYLRATYTAGNADIAVIKPIKDTFEEKKVRPSAIEPERLEEFLGDPITWQDLYDRTKKIEGGLFYYPQMPATLPLGEYATSAGDLITIESDHATIEEQQETLQKFEDLTKLKFFAKIFSGKKSIHANIGLDDRMDWEEGDYLFKLCFLAFLSDPSLGSHAAIGRYPGGVRKSKDGSNEQALLEHSGSRYSYAIVKSAIQSFYLVRHGVSAPEVIPTEWWGEVRKRLLSPGKHGDPKEMIVRGVEAWQEEKAAEQKAIEAERAKMVKEYGGSKSETTFRGRAWAAIREARKRAPAPHLRKGTNIRDAQSDDGIKTIGFCPIHGGNSGSSARVRKKNGETRFACWTCTYDGRTRVDVDPLEYAYLESGASFHQIPRGGNLDDWILLPQLESFAREFCRRNGVEMPTREMVNPIDKTVKKKLSAVPKVVQQEDPKEEPSPEPKKVVELKEKSRRWDPSLVKQELQKIVNEGLQGAEQQEAFLALCDRAGYAQGELHRLFDAVKEGDDKITLSDRFSKLSSDAIDDYLLPLAWYNQVLNIQMATGLSFPAIQAPILAIASSLTSRTKLCLVPSSGWFVKPQIWSATLGRPGAKKSYVVGIAGEPLVSIDKEVMAKYHAERSIWLKEKKTNEKAVPPKFVPRHCMQEYTLEALEKQLIINDGRGIAIYTDELKAWFGAMGRYSKNGGGLEAARWCQLYEGRTYDRSRASDLTDEGGEQAHYINEPVVSICGAIQPEVIVERMRKEKDGLIDRYLWTKTPPDMSKLEYDSPEIEAFYYEGRHQSKYPLFDELRNAYEMLQYQNVGLILRLDDQAKIVYKEFFDKMADLGNQEDIETLRPLYPKHQTHAAKLAIASHMMKMAVGEIPTTSVLISEETMKAATALAEHSLIIALELWLESQDSLDCEVLSRKIIELHAGKTINWGQVRSLGRSIGKRQVFKKEEVMKIFTYMEAKGYADRNNDEITVKK